MKNLLEKYLPAGTVVRLAGASKRLMIVGFCTTTENDKSKMWDYSGYIFPEGLLQSNQICLFDHSQIEEIYHLGLIDEEEKQFKEKLKNAVKNQKEKSAKE